MGLKANLSEAKKTIKRTRMLKKNKNIGLKGKGFFPTALIGCIIYFSCRRHKTYKILQNLIIMVSCNILPVNSV